MPWINQILVHYHVSLKGIEPRTPVYVSPKTAFNISLFVLRPITSKIYQQTAREKPKEAHKIEAEASCWMLGDSVKMEDWEKYSYSWFQTCAVFWILYVFIWVIPRCLNFIYRRFGTICFIFIGGSAYENRTDSVPKRRRIKFRRRGITQKKEYKIQLHYAVVECGVANSFLLFIQRQHENW
jgi:hypothetical protein